MKNQNEATKELESAKAFLATLSKPEGDAVEALKQFVAFQEFLRAKYRPALEILHNHENNALEFMASIDPEIKEYAEAVLAVKTAEERLKEAKAEDLIEERKQWDISRRRLV